MPAQQTQIRNSTQEHLSIREIQDDLVILKDNSCCLVLKTTAINFGLLSEKEQEATIFAYAALLNSLIFPIQIAINSRQKDISVYLNLVSRQLQYQKDEKLKIQIKKYREFLDTIVQKNKVLDKRFYLIIPFPGHLYGKLSKKDLLEKAKNDLYPKRDHLLSQFQRLGLKVYQLTSQELIELYYSIYNPDVEGQKFVPVEEYSAPLIQKISQPTAVSPSPVQTPIPVIPKPSFPQPVSSLKEFGQKNNQQPLVGQKLQEKINNIVAGVKKT